jgi:hypothetical protein
MPPTWLLAMIVALAIVAGGFALALPWPHETAMRRQCDVAVHSLLTTHDEIELQRAAFTIYWLDCSMSRRLPEP